MNSAFETSSGAGPGPGSDGSLGTNIATVNRTVRLISIDLIDPNPLAPREVYTSEMIRERADELRTQGQHDPIHLVPNPEFGGRFVIADGWTRVLACRVHRIQEALVAEVHSGLTLQDAAWFGYEQNEGRQAHCDLDRAMFFARLIAAGETATEIARRTRIGKSTLTAFLKFAKLPAEILEIAKKVPDKFSYNVASILARGYDTKCAASSPHQATASTLGIAQRFANEDKTRKWLEDQVAALCEPIRKKGPKVARKIIPYANGVMRQRGAKFEVVMVVDSEDKRASFAAALENLLETVGEKVAGQVEPISDGSSSG